MHLGAVAVTISATGGPESWPIAPLLTNVDTLLRRGQAVRPNLLSRLKEKAPCSPVGKLNILFLKNYSEYKVEVKGKGACAV